MGQKQTPPGIQWWLMIDVYGRYALLWLVEEKHAHILLSGTVNKQKKVTIIITHSWINWNTELKEQLTDTPAASVRHGVFYVSIW